MLLRLVLSLVTFAAFRFVMYSDNPDLIALRAQLYAAVIEGAASSKVTVEPDQTNLQKLHARVAAEANPCTQADCPDEGETADQIRSNPRPAADSKSGFSPKFVSVSRKN